MPQGSMGYALETKGVIPYPPLHAYARACVRARA